MDISLDTFFESQLQEWPTAHQNHEALTRVWCRELASAKLPIPLHVQCNPARIVSTGARIDKASIAARPCFLCAQNRPEEQHSLDLNDDFEWLVNPFPILPNHYTIAAKQHRPQCFLDAYDAMLQAIKTLPEGYIVFYNGPKCGASAPDHLHLQAGDAANIPLVKYAQTITSEGNLQVISPFGYLVYLIHDTENTDTFRRVYEQLPIPQDEYEPYMNIVAYRKGKKVSLLIIPRRAHRPQCYSAEGEAKYLVSPGTLDMCGLIITPRSEDYERLTATQAADILCEVGVRTEPTIDVGIMQGKEIEFTIYGASPLPLPRRGDSDATEPPSPTLRPGTYCASIKEGKDTEESYITIKGEDAEHIIEGTSIVLTMMPVSSPSGGRHGALVSVATTEALASSRSTACSSFEGAFSLHGVTIGKEFHWQQQETQTFQGKLILRIIDGELHAINRIAIEDYLTSVIASEMSGTSSIELLKAHAVISRSWLLAQLNSHPSAPHREEQKGVIRWYDREAHTHFDVCADDHCQRYQGVHRKITAQVHEAIRATRGIVLSYEGEVCDARFSKYCGGITELYESCWDDTPHPYLSVVHDPFCNTDDPKILSEVLNHYDQGTDFYRWTVEYTQEELSELVRRRGGFDYGDIVDLTPIERGPSGRIVRLQIVGTKATRIIGKELEIRRTLSETHLYSSAFEVEKRGASFILHGSGWGHGVGLCQIGAAVMGAQGYKFDEILHHYYPNAELTEWYIDTNNLQCSSEVTVST